MATQDSNTPAESRESLLRRIKGIEMRAARLQELRMLIRQPMDNETRQELLRELMSDDE